MQPSAAILAGFWSGVAQLWFLLSGAAVGGWKLGFTWVAVAV